MQQYIYPFTTMKKFHILLFSIFVLLSSRPVQATHVMGADLQYVCLGNGKYKIVASVYRDCRGIPLLESQINFWMHSGSPETGFCGNSLPLAFTRVSIEDLTPVCDTARLRCQPTNTTIVPYGVEKHVFECVVDFRVDPYKTLINNTTCCAVTFAFGHCCRNGAISTGASSQNFTTYCTLNLCELDGGCNSSPVFSNPPIFYTCCNQPYRFNHGLIDTSDQDSVVFELAPPLQTVTDPTSFGSKFSYKYPVTPYCKQPGTVNCQPDPNAAIPEGFFFNPMNGDMVYTPTDCSETAIIAVLATEFRKIGGAWKKVGTTRRDMQVQVLNCAQNIIPGFSGVFDTCVEEGDTLVLEIQTNDSLVGQQTRGDSLSMDWNGGIKGASFSVGNSKNPTAVFRWVVPAGSSRHYPYVFSVHAKDNNCPMYSESYRGVRIWVGHCDELLAQEKHELPAWHLYPNPVRPGGLIHLSIPANEQIVLRDLSGRTVYRGMARSGEFPIPQGIQNGVYTLEISHRGKHGFQTVLIGE
jgi:hypothetical protein